LDSVLEVANILPADAEMIKPILTQFYNRSLR
jgi:hypothetical protein